MGWRVGGVLLALAVIFATVMAVLRLGRRPSQRLADGTTLTLLSANVAHAYTDVHGTPLERLLGPLLPTKGWVHLWKLHLQRPLHLGWTNPYPEGCFLVVKLHLSGDGPALQRSAFLRSTSYRRFRFVTIGEDGFRYVWELQGFKHYHDGYFAYVVTEDFPRDSKRLQFRIDRRATQSARWTTVASFTARPRHANTAPSAGLANWKPENSPATWTTDGLQFTLGKILVTRLPSPQRDIWEYLARIPIHIAKGGVTLTNWGANGIRIEDASGNRSWAGIKAITNGWTVYQCWVPADPRRVWRLTGNFGMNANFPATNLLTVRLPISSSKPLTTNFSGMPLRFRRDSWGEGYVDGELLTNCADVRLDLVSIDGTDPTPRSGVWSSRFFHRSLEAPPNFSPPPAGSTVTVTVAVQRNIPIQFTVQPRLATSNGLPTK